MQPAGPHLETTARLRRNAAKRVIGGVCVLDPIETENRAWLARVTCGWKKPDLKLEDVCRYWRDVHSPAIARRPGLWEYRHSQYAPVRPDLLPPVPGIETTCPDDAQLMWLSDVRYADQAGLDAFSASPPPDVRREMLCDIEMIVDRSTTYRVVQENAVTLADTTNDPVPQGPPPCPSYSLFFRARAEEPEFRATLRALAERWASQPGVRRVRLNLFDVPDMEAERRAGYPIKTHPQPQQYQAWIELMLDNDSVAAALIAPGHAGDLAAAIGTLHAYPTRVTHCFNRAGRPTLAGLRGFAAYDAIKALGATHQTDAGLLHWMYGDIACDICLA